MRDSELKSLLGLPRPLLSPTLEVSFQFAPRGGEGATQQTPTPVPYVGTVLRPEVNPGDRHHNRTLQSDRLQVDGWRTSKRESLLKVSECVCVVCVNRY